MAREVERGSPGKRSVKDSDIEQSGELVEEIERIVKWAHNLPDDVR